MRLRNRVEGVVNSLLVETGWVGRVYRLRTERPVTNALRAGIGHTWALCPCHRKLTVGG